MGMSSIDYSHLGRFLDPHHLRKLLDLAERALGTHEFDTLAFRGMSGAFLGPALAVKLDKQMVLVRKPEDSTHYRMDVEGFKDVRRYIIVDDLVSTGETKQAIIDAMDEFAPDACFVGLLEVKKIDSKTLYDVLNVGSPYPLN